MTKSMACPFCAMRDEACYVNGLNGAAVYQCQWCGAQTNCQEEWETRPLEESLRDKNEILQSKLAREHQVSDALYLLLVDDPNTKLQADQILINIFGKCEPSNSDVSVTENVLTDVKTGQSVEKVECSWIQEDDPDICYWKTGCGNSFYFTEGTPTDNNMKYCCYCGKLLKQED